MIYKINNKYYINISPRIYKEISISVRGDKVTVKALKNKIETNANTKIVKVSLDEVKEELKKEIKNKYYE